MSLYYEAATFLAAQLGTDASLTARIYGAKALKSKPAQVFALVSESTKWSSVLSGIIDTAGILRLERKLTPVLALVLTHDLLLARGGVAAPKDHVLKLAISRHKARLSAEFTKARLKAGFPSVEAWRAGLAVEIPEDETGDQQDVMRKFGHPRWVRVNTLKTTLNEQLDKGAFTDWDTKALSVEALTQKRGGQRLIVDKTIPNLVAAAPGSDFSKTDAYRRGKVILQDKASCFPAYLLDPQPSDGDIIDGCAAPGNKTTHLAALAQESRSRAGKRPHRRQTVYAVERNVERAKTLHKMVHTAGADADKRVQILPGQDFSLLDPDDARWRNVGAILLDPSCSGSGMMSRDDGNASTAAPLILPRAAGSAGAAPSPSASRNSKKRKRTATAAEPAPALLQPDPPSDDISDNTASSSDDDEEPLPNDSTLTARLTSLSTFQLTLLLHAFRFPGARKVVYSTCSIHAAENEHVVLRALQSRVAKDRGWRVLRRDEQVEGLRAWGVRGDGAAVAEWISRGEESGKVESEEVRQACLRCEKGTEEGTMGFFAVGFVRDRGGEGALEEHGYGGHEEEEEEEEEEWAGLSEQES